MRKQQDKDIFDFKTVIYHHLDRILAASDNESFRKYVERMLYVLMPYCKKSSTFMSIAAEAIEDGKVSSDEAQLVLSALSYVMQETELSPPIKVEGFVDERVFEMMWNIKEDEDNNVQNGNTTKQ